MKNLPSPSEIIHFLEVAKALNVSRAAERLGVTQPSLSISLKKLEDKLGLELLIRSKSGVQLTQAGQRFQQKAQLLLTDWTKLRSEALNEKEEIMGEFVIGAHPSVSLYTLNYFMPKLLHAGHNLKIHLEHDLSRKITEQVISYKIDYGIVVNPVAHNDLVVTELCRDEVCLWTSKKPSELQRLGGEISTLIFDPDLAQSLSLLGKLRKKGFSFSRDLHSRNLEVIASMVYHRMGIGILPARVAKRLDFFDLQRVKDSPVFEDRICLIYRADKPKLAAHRYIVDAIKSGKY